MWSVQPFSQQGETNMHHSSHASFPLLMLTLSHSLPLKHTHTSKHTHTQSRAASSIHHRSDSHGGCVFLWQRSRGWDAVPSGDTRSSPSEPHRTSSNHGGPSVLGETKKKKLFLNILFTTTYKDFLVTSLFSSSGERVCVREFVCTCHSLRLPSMSAWLLRVSTPCL